MQKCTPLQGQYLAYIDAYLRIHGVAPSEQDLERHFQVTPPSVHQMVLRLEQKGLIGRVPGTPRSITLKAKSEDLPALGSPKQKEGGRRTARPQPPPAPRKPRKTARGKRSARPDRMDEYVNSSLMSHRLKYKDRLTARVSGRYGVYRTSVTLSRKVIHDCTCPSDVWPCKHARALLATWQLSPQTFLDLESCVRALAGYSKEQLLDAIAQLLMLSPRALWVLGIPGFEALSDDDDDDAEVFDFFDDE